MAALDTNYQSNEFQRADCAPRVRRGIRCILATQLKDAAGRPNVWCQQHDALTLKACAARNFEPIAACTNESASTLRFLMSIPKPSAGASSRCSWSSPSDS